MSFQFTEDKINKAAEPIKTGIYDVVIENAYITEEHSTRSGLDYIQFHLELLDTETDRKIQFTGMNGFYAGVIEDGVYTFLNPKKEGKDRTVSRVAEMINSMFFLLFKQSFEVSKLHESMKLQKAKALNYKKEEIDVYAIPDLIGQNILVAITRIEDGYVKDGTTWVDTQKPRLDTFLSAKTNKTAYETFKKIDGTPYKDKFEVERPEDYVEALWDKTKIEQKKKFSSLQPQAQASEGTTAGAPITASMNNLL